MSTRTTSRALGWLIGLLLLVCWNLQAEVRLTFTETDSIQASTSFRDPDPDPDPHFPINLTATVGLPFEQALPFVIPTQGLVSISITGLPANGLNFEPVSGDPGIQGIPLTSGVMNLTLLVNNGFPGMSWRPISLTVNPNPNPNPDPDPDPHFPINLTATVGLPFEQALPFVIPTQGLVSISVTGLPANGLNFGPGSGGTPTIDGVPLTSGVMSLTLLVNNGFPGMSWRPISLTVNPNPNPNPDPDPDPHFPINLTATVGLPFEQALPFVIPTQGLVSISITGIPANGLHFETFSGGTPGIQGIPLTSGVMNLTLLVNNGFPGMSWRPISLTVNPNPTISLTATVGLPFQQTLPYLVAPVFIVSQEVTGLPANGLQFETSGTPSIQGVPLTAGVMNLTLINGLATGAAWRPITITVNPSATSFAITGVNLISCQTISATQRQLTFTPQYAGTTGQPILFTVYQQLPFTTQPGPYSLNLNTSNPLITLIAQQNGVIKSLNYQWLAACNTTTPNRPPTTTGIPTQTAQPGHAYQLSLANYFADPDGNPLTYIVSGLPSPLTKTGVIISGTPASTGSFPISVTAVDPGGLFVSTSFQLTVNGTTPPTQPFTLVSVTTNGCQNLGGNQWQVTFTPQYTGLTGEQIVLAMTNGTITTQAGPYSQTLSTDKPLLTLIAQQGPTTSAYNYFWLAACTGGARRAASEVGNGLQVKVFGNPVQGQQVEVELSGVMGRWVEVTVLDMQGRSHYQQRLDWSTDGDRISLPVGQGAGTQLVQVRTEQQAQTVKLIKSR